MAQKRERSSGRPALNHALFCCSKVLKTPEWMTELPVHSSRKHMNMLEWSPAFLAEIRQSSTCFYFSFYFCFYFSTVHLKTAPLH